MVDVRVRVLAVMVVGAMEDVLVGAMEAEILMVGLALEGVTIGIRYLNGEMTWRAMSRSLFVCEGNRKQAWSKAIAVEHLSIPV